jgi:outer membrane protein
MRCLFLVLMLFFSLGSFAQQNLDDYIQMGLKNNNALREQQLNYDKALWALREAKGMYLPSLNFQSRFSVAMGGRVIEFPIGDMLNPAYTNLNGINDFLETASFGIYPSIPDYPTIDNLEFNFFRTTDQETKLQLTQPLFNAQIYHNHQLKKEQLGLQQITINQYKRSLVCDIKTAYYNYAKSLEYIELLEKAEALVVENIRVSQKLFELEKVTKDQLLRAQSEQTKLQQELNNATLQSQTARAYFNFLLNEPLSSPIDTAGLPTEAMLITLESAQQSAKQGREELDLLQGYESVADKAIKLSSAAYIPTLTLVGEYGIQGTTYKFTKEDDYGIASVVLQWDLFKGGQNWAKIKQAKLDKEIVKQQYTQAEKQIELEVFNLYNELQSRRKVRIGCFGRNVSAGRQKVWSPIGKSIGIG